MLLKPALWTSKQNWWVQRFTAFVSPIILWFQITFIMRKLLLFVFLCAVAISAFAQNGCPSCTATLPDTLPADTIYLSDADSGQVGQAYNSDLSFRMPKSTTPVAASDPSVLPGLNISEVTIVSVTNLPPGLSWEANQRIFKTAQETDGCVKFCGTPLQPGLYEVEVVVDAQVLVVTQTTSFTIPILIEPAVVVTEGFTMENASGCGEVEVRFTNNVPSAGAAGFAYSWDFGNGSTSDAETPEAQYYSEPGHFPVHYQAIIDTTGYFLTKVEVTDFSCSDFLGGRPDLQLEVFDPVGNLLFKSDIVDNASKPTSFNLNVKLEAGDYMIRVIDDDSGLFGGGNDECGTLRFNRETATSLREGDLEANFSIIHPVDTVRSVDTVTVFAQPADPIVTGYEGEQLCAGDVVDLLSSYTDNIQWFRDSMTVLESGINTLLTIPESGRYWVQYTSPDGCRAVSDTVHVAIAELPDNPIFLNDNNFLEVIDDITLPADFSAQWYLGGEALPNATGTAFCAFASGSYELVVTDNATGCLNRFSRIVTFNPDFAGCSAATSTEDVFGIIASDFKLFPNPTNGRFWLEFATHEQAEVHVIVRNALGSIVQQLPPAPVLGDTRFDMDISGQAAGMYFVELRIGERRHQWKIIKNQ